MKTGSLYVWQKPDISLYPFLKSALDLIVGKDMVLSSLEDPAEESFYGYFINRQQMHNQRLIRSIVTTDTALILRKFVKSEIYFLYENQR